MWWIRYHKSRSNVICFSVSHVNFSFEGLPKSIAKLNGGGALRVCLLDPPLRLCIAVSIEGVSPFTTDILVRPMSLYTSGGT